MVLALNYSWSTESFLNELDQKMYAEKKAYHQEHTR